MKRCAIYARVSTAEQNPDLQLETLRDYARRRDFEIACEFVDRVTGDLTSEKRSAATGYRQLIKQARSARPGFDVVLVWKFDRLARSLAGLLQALEVFSAHSIDFVSITQQIDTTTPAGRLFFQIVGAFGEFERELIVERVRAGIRSARARGVKWGRRRDSGIEARVFELHRAGCTLRGIARVTGRSYAGVRQILARGQER